MDLNREKKRAILRYAGYIAGTLGVGGLSALLSRGGMETFAHLKKPAFAPPGWVFPVAWTLLYILMAISAAMIAGEGTKESRDALFTYWAQLFVNFWWSIFFFAWDFGSRPFSGCFCCSLSPRRWRFGLERSVPWPGN